MYQGILWIVIGVGMIVAALLYTLVRVLTTIFRKNRCTMEVSAVVSGMKTKRRGKGKTGKTYYPILTYDVDGEEYHRTSKLEAIFLGEEYDVGNTVVIHVDPLNPKRIFVEKGNTKSIVLMAVCVAVIGIGCMVYGLLQWGKSQ